jgi:hypothetical protein
MRCATADALFLGQLDIALMQFPETGPEVAAGRIFKVRKKNAKVDVISARQTILQSACP